jgi:hypothetical protein
MQLTNRVLLFVFALDIFLVRDVIGLYFLSRDKRLFVIDISRLITIKVAYSSFAFGKQLMGRR